MRRETAWLSLGYWFSAYTLGLLVHPYKTTRELSRIKLYRPLIISPIVFWLLAWMAGMLGLVLGRRIMEMGGMEEVPQQVRLFLSFGFWWLSWFMVLWQILLGYLWLRFRKFNLK